MEIMKEHTFTVTLTFNDEVEADEHTEEMTERLLDAITFYTDGIGIAPEETFTTHIDVNHDETGFGVMKHLDP